MYVLGWDHCVQFVHFDKSGVYKLKIELETE